MNNQAYHLYRLLREISVCCREREIIQAKALGLKISEIRALTAVITEHCHSAAELSKSLDVVSSRVTRIIDGLVDKGLAVRSESSGDRRVCLINLTQKGEETARMIVEFTLKLHDEALKSLPADLRGKSLKLLTAIKDAMSSVGRRLEKGEFDSILADAAVKTTE